MAPESIRVAGFDLGKTSVGLAIAIVGPDGIFSWEWSGKQPHEGRPFEIFSRWYHEHQLRTCAALAATGVFADELAEPILLSPEDAAQEAALEMALGLPASLNLLSVGGRGYGVLSRQGTPHRYQYLENDKCSSGTGENIVKICTRFGLTLEAADELAQTATEGVAITARCSVFAKSEMTHYANQGKPAPELLLGYFSSVARNARALLARNQVAGPVILVGGCARIVSFRRALEASLGQPVRVPENFLTFEAMGAASIAAQQLASRRLPALPADPEGLIRRKAQRFTELRPAEDWKDRVTVLPGRKEEVDWFGSPSILGLDLGSTGAKAVLTSVATGEMFLDVYDRTQGNPLDAARRLVSTILERGDPNIRAIGVTGSGREAVATLLRGVFPSAAFLLVRNEIVAHATAAIACDPDGGKDLTVIEIGGQDAKYIRISGGRIVESDMNKACSAGTGSFLEEQAAVYDIRKIEDFVAMAGRAKRPPELGQMCTVYVADAGAQALKDGFALDDIFAGFQYSVVHNYLNRVMGQRALSAKIFFQGKPASSPSLGWTLAAVTGREIIVPSNPGAMGAWGIGLCALRLWGAETLETAPQLDLAGMLSAEITERSEFRCRDAQCQTLCPIERTVIRVGNDARTALSGGACPKYEIAAQSLPKLPKDAPDPFVEREALLGEFQDAGEGPEVAIPRTGGVMGYVPWLATVVRELGFRAKILASDSRTLAQGEQMCNSFDSCGPTKIAHAICDTTAPFLLFPKILAIGDREGRGGQTCVTEQAMPEIVEQSLQARGRNVTVLRPRIDFSRGTHGAHARLVVRQIARELGVTADIAGVVKKASEAQARYEQDLETIGTRAIAWGRGQKVPMVVVCGVLSDVRSRVAQTLGLAFWDDLSEQNAEIKLREKET